MYYIVQYLILHATLGEVNVNVWREAEEFWGEAGEFWGKTSPLPPSTG